MSLRPQDFVDVACYVQTRKFVQHFQCFRWILNQMLIFDSDIPLLIHIKLVQSSPYFLKSRDKYFSAQLFVSSKSTMVGPVRG